MLTTPFLLVPGLNCTEEAFRHLIPALWPLGPVTVANHLEGETLAAIAANILRDAPPTFALIGFSMGGYIAFEMLRQAPGRVTKLCLLDSSARPDAPEASEKRRLNIAKARAGAFEEVIAGAFPIAVHPDHAGNTELRALHTRMSRAIGPETYMRQQQAIIARPDSRPDLPGIGVSTLVVVGEADQITVPDAAAEMASGIPHARLVIVEGAGHMALLERPEAVTGAVVEWAKR